MRANVPAPARTPAPAPAAPAPAAPVVAKPRAKLSYKEQRELEELPARLEALESEQKALEAEMATPAFYTQAKQVVADKQARFGLIEEQLMAMLERWEALSQK